VCGACCASERGHKDMNNVCTKARNRLGWQKAEAIMSIRINAAFINAAVTDVDYKSPVSPGCGRLRFG
jgi:hypothetical protein